MGSQKTANAAMEFIVELLRSQPGLSFADVKAAAAARQLEVMPILFGRAKALLGLVPVAPRGQGKRALRGKRASGATPPPPTRSMPDAAVTDDALEAVLAGVRGSEAQRVRYRQALLRIRDILQAGQTP
jgi:hypothetical protein